MILLESYAIYISIFSLLISFLTLYRQRKRLTVTWQENCYVLNPKTDIFFNGEPYPTSAKVAFYTSVNIVNPSNVNMGLGGACVQMAFNLGNAIGAYIGGLALSGGYRYPALAGVPFALMGFILFLVFYKKFQDKY